MQIPSVSTRLSRLCRTGTVHRTCPRLLLSILLTPHAGGVILVSHDSTLIHNVCKELWVVADEKAEKFYGDVQAYKSLIVRRILTYFSKWTVLTLAYSRWPTPRSSRHEVVAGSHRVGAAALACNACSVSIKLLID